MSEFRAYINSNIYFLQCNPREMKTEASNTNKKSSKDLKTIVSTPPLPVLATPAVKYTTRGLGSISKNFPDAKDTFFLTTAIAYTNGYPHMGHAYEFLTSDIIIRYQRVYGKKTFFLTGSDEHGQKVANSAEASNRTPLEHCDHYVEAFQVLNKRLAISLDKYMRTTDPHHEWTAQQLWLKCAAVDDIYLSKYEGWYNEREETFVTDAEAEANGFKDPGNGLPLKKVTEESYFFKMSKFTDQLIQHIENNDDFIQPDLHKNAILNRLKSEGLKDLSISRTTFDWGIRVPAGFDQNHVMYVWFDALTNYLTGVHALDSYSPSTAPKKDTEQLHSFWPSNVHIIGKDIIWFHTVIWPCMLFSANIPLPKRVFAHGFVNAADGRKMSKSYNNSVDPNDMLDKYPLDAIRYYLCTASTYGADLNFSEQSLVTMHDSELADILGNLVHRVCNLTVQYCGSVIPDTQHDPAFPLPFDLEILSRECEQCVNSYAINTAVFKAMEAVRATNR